GHQALSASPSDHTAAPSSTTSFRRNWPGTTDSAGKPPRLDSQPGVERRKLSVVRNIMTAIALPTAAIRGDAGRSAIITATAISTVPSWLERLHTEEAVHPPHERAAGHQRLVATPSRMVREGVGHVYADARVFARRSARVRFLVDTGATYTIVPPSLVREVGAAPSPTTFRVSLADGSTRNLRACTMGIELC